MNILQLLKQHDKTSDLWSKQFAWTRPREVSSDISTVWTFIGRKSAEEPEGIGTVTVEKLHGENMLRVSCGATWWVDLRSPEEIAAAELTHRLDVASAKARRAEGWLILAEEAASRRDRQLVSRDRQLVSGDVVMCEAGTFMVDTLRASALRLGKDPAQVLAENERRRAAGERFQDPDRGNEWFPYWDELVWVRSVTRLTEPPNINVPLRHGGEVEIEGNRYTLVVVGRYLKVVPAATVAVP